MINKSFKSSLESKDTDKKIEESDIQMPRYNRAIDPWDREIPHKVNRHNYQDFNYEDYDERRDR